MRAQLLINWTIALHVMVVLALITAPYLYAARAGRADYVFGGFLLNPLDGNTYLAKMYQGWRGDWRFTLPYTAEPGEGAYIYPLYLLLGHFSRWAGLPLLLTFHSVRVLAAILLLLVLYRFLLAAECGQSTLIRLQNWAFTLLALGSGLGWLAFLFGKFTSDFWVAEAFPFLSAYVNPHFPLSLALLLWLLTIPEHKRWSDDQPIWLTSLGSLLLALLSPFGVVLALVVLAGLFAWELWPRLATRAWIAARPRPAQAEQGPSQAAMERRVLLARRLLGLSLGGAPWLIYIVWVMRIDPVMAGWNSQNITLSPPLWDLFVSLSPALFLVIPGAWHVFKRSERRGHFTARLWLVWLMISLALLYLPFGLQRRFMMGLFVPVVGLAGYGLARLAESLGKRARLVATTVLILSLPTNLLVLLAGVHGVQTHDPMLYLSSSEKQALEWIASSTPEDALILASPQMGLFIPAHTGRRVIYGHPFETVNAQNEEQAVTNFFSKMNQSEAEMFLGQRQVDYVFYGARERSLGHLPNPGDMVPVCTVGEVTIYRVSAKAGAAQ